MPFCTSVDCSNRLRRGCGKTFHRFPRSRPALLKEWLLKMRRSRWTPSQHSTICSDHFEESCFDRTGQTTRLRADAVPTLFNYPENLVKTVVRHRKPPFPRVSTQPEPQAEPVAAANESPGEKPPGAQHPDAQRDSPQGDITGPSLPRTPTKIHPAKLNHTYCINESPKSLKRKIDKMFNQAASLHKRLKTSQTRSRRLCKKVDTLQAEVKTLREKNLQLMNSSVGQAPMS